MAKENPAMSYIYSNPARERDPHALPNVQVFHVEAAEFKPGDGTWMAESIESALRDRGIREYDENDPEHVEALAEEQELLEGWYWWACFPGCMPDGDANGPFPTEALAAASARDADPEGDEDDVEGEGDEGDDASV